MEQYNTIGDCNGVVPVEPPAAAVVDGDDVPRQEGDQPPCHAPPPRWKRNWIGFFLLGLCTHLQYSIMDTAANTIVTSYNASGYIATVYGASNGATFLVKNINAFLLVRVAYGTRFLCNSVIMLAGITGLAFSQSFAPAIISIVLVGAANAFGENIALGYLARFDSRQVTAWGSGFGLAGLVGSIVFVFFGCLLPTTGVPNDMRNLDMWAFISSMPAVIVYLAAVFQIIREPPPSPQAVVRSTHPSVSSRGEEGEVTRRQTHSDEATPLLKNTADILRVQQDQHGERTTHYGPINSDIHAGNAAVSNWAKLKVFLVQVKRCFRMILWLGFNLTVIQLTSYSIRIAAAKARPIDSRFGCPDLYSSLQLCFQAGVFAAQSSLPIGKIRSVGVLSFLQTVNMFVWLFNVRDKFLPETIMPLLMIFAGLLQGVVYVNIFYMIRTDSKYPAKDRELCANLAAIFQTIGLSMSCILLTALYNTVLFPY